MAGATLLALDAAELERFVLSRGGRPFHARDARRNVLGKGILDYERMTSLPAALRARLSSELPILASREVGRSTAGDGTTKLLLEFPRRKSEDATVEMVHMPSLYVDEVEEAEDGKGRGATLCVSTQVGCPIACPFCASGKLGLARNL